MSYKDVTDCKMLRHMAGVKFQDGKSKIEVRDMCGVEGLCVKLRQRSLRWFGRVRRQFVE